MFRSVDEMKKAVRDASAENATKTINKYGLYRDDFGLQVAFMGEHGHVRLSNKDIVRHLNGFNSTFDTTEELIAKQAETIAKISDFIGDADNRNLSAETMLMNLRRILAEKTK